MAPLVPSSRRAALVSVLVALAGCVGDLDAGPLGSGGRGPVSPTEPTVCTDPAPGAAPLRRITETQWRATVEALFPGSTGGVAFPRTLYRRGYRTDAVLGEVSRDGSVAIGDASAAIAEAVVPADVSRLLGCTPTTDAADACLARYVEQFGARAFRRPLHAEERATFTALYADLVGDEALSVQEGVVGVVEAILASPQLHYLTTDVADSDGEVIHLPDHAIAERMSYLLWNEPPDETLRAAADEGRLSSREDIERETRRMVTDARTTRMISGFVEDWLELHRVRGMTKDPTAFPAWASGLAGSIQAEHEAFVTQVMNDDGRLHTLLAADFAVVDPRLAEIYGTGSGEGRVALGPERRGILNLSGFLAGHAGATEPAPVLRGVTVIRQVLCEDMELPVGLAVTSPPQDPTRTTRERFNAHRADPVCAGCHDRIDPIGFAFEDFDAVGEHRNRDENGLSVDATGRVRSVDGALDVRVDGGAEVADALAASPVVRSCFARQVFGYAEGRVLSRIASDAAIDNCAVSQIAAQFAESDGDIRELLVAITTSEAFRERRIER